MSQHLQTLVNEQASLIIELQACLQLERNRAVTMQAEAQDAERTLFEEIERVRAENVELRQDVLLSKEEAARLRTAMHAAEKQLESRANDVLPATQHTGPRAESADNHAQDAASRMRLERQRAELTTSLSALEKDFIRQKTRADAADARVAALSSQLTAARSSLATATAETAAVRKEVTDQRQPVADLRREVARMAADNGRLVAMLEAASAASELGGSEGAAALATRTYASVSDVLSSHDPSASQYSPVDDRPVVFHEELAYWVPKEAVKLAQGFSKRLALPTGEFIEFLLKLNKVWRAREEEVIAKERSRNRDAVAALKRQAGQRTPYRQAVSDHTVYALQSQLHAMRRVALAPGDPEKLMMDWGLGAIEKLAAQAAKACGQNDELRSRLSTKAIPVLPVDVKGGAPERRRPASAGHRSRRPGGQENGRGGEGEAAQSRAGAVFSEEGFASRTVGNAVAGRAGPRPISGGRRSVMADVSPAAIFVGATASGRGRSPSVAAEARQQKKLLVLGAGGGVAAAAAAATLAGGQRRRMQARAEEGEQQVFFSSSAHVKAWSP